MRQPATCLSRRYALGLAGALALSGCGFALRKPPNFAFRTIYLQLPGGSSLGPVLTRALEFNPDVQVIPSSGNMQTADVILQVTAEQRERVVISVNAAGQVREFQLRLRMNFNLRTPQGRELIAPTELVLEREIAFAEALALAKEQEEELLYRDMRDDMVRQILRRLGALKDLSGTPQAPTR